MKKLLVTVAVAIAVVLAIQAAPTTPDVTAELVKAMNIQNQQLKRIADSLALISGEQPGWKLPK